MESTTTLGIIFLVVGGLVTLSELHTLTVYLIAVAVGLFVAGAMALAGIGITADLAVLAIIILLGLPLAHWWRGKLKNREADEVSEDDVGRSVTIVSVTGNTLRVDYRGSTWDARLDAESDTVPANGDTFQITRREGNLLILAP